MFGDIPRNIWRHSLECLRTFPGMFGDIPWIIWRHSLGMFGDIPRNVWGHFSECLRTFPGMFGNIPRNITLPLFLIPRVPRIPFPVLAFLVLYIAPKCKSILKFNVELLYT